MRKRTVTIVFLTVVAACSAPPSDSLQELTGGAMGTTFSVKMVTPPDAVDSEDIGRQAEQVLAIIERQMSTYIADSEISSFNAQRSVDWYRVSAELCSVVSEALTLAAATDGAFDITVGPLVNLWGFGPTGQVLEPPDDALIATLLHAIGYEALHADCAVPALRKDVPDLYVDLSAYAKGYGVDQLAAVLDAAGVGNYLVEIGGELRLRGQNASGDNWGIAIESPDRAGRAVQSVVRVSDAAIATSGDYRNFFEHEGRMYSHTIDPRTGYPVAHAAASVTVIADTAAYADAMATALLVMGPEDGIDFAEREDIAVMFLLREDGALKELSSTAFATRIGAS